MTGSVTVPTGYMVITIEEYTRLVEESMKYAIMEEHIPEEWCKSVLDIFITGMSTVSHDKKLEEREKQEDKKHKCPDPGKLKSLMYAGWRAADIAGEIGAPLQDVYEWMAEAIRADMELPAALRMYETKLEVK